MRVPVEYDFIFEQVDPAGARVRGHYLFDDGGVGYLGLGLLVLAAESFHQVCGWREAYF